MIRLEQTHQGNFFRYVFQPGNGTRYEILYCPDLNAGTFLFGWTNRLEGPVVAEFRTGNYMDVYFFAQKLNLIPGPDATVLLDLAQELEGAPHAVQG